MTELLVSAAFVREQSSEALKDNPGQEKLNFDSDDEFWTGWQVGYVTVDLH